GREPESLGLMGAPHQAQPPANSSRAASSTSRAPRPAFIPPPPPLCHHNPCLSPRKAFRRRKGRARQCKMKPGGIPLTDDHLESRPKQAGFPRRALLLWAAALFLAAILFWRVHVPLFIIAPGLTMPAGEIVKVSAEGAVEQERGTFLVTTLAARQASLGTALAAIFDPRSHVVLRRQLVPPGQTVDEYLAENEELMRQSQVYAMAAALDYLGYSPRVTGAGAEVRRVLPGLRPAGALQVGDVIVAVDGRPVGLAEDLHDDVA